jgi:hypothetical protein
MYFNFLNGIGEGRPMRSPFEVYRANITLEVLIVVLKQVFPHASYPYLDRTVPHLLTNLVK